MVMSEKRKMFGIVRRLKANASTLEKAFRVEEFQGEKKLIERNTQSERNLKR